MNSTATGGDIKIYTSNNPPPPWSETEHFKTLDWALSLLQHENPDVSADAALIVSLYNECLDTGSTIARCSLGEGIGWAVIRIRKALEKS